MSRPTQTPPAPRRLTRQAARAGAVALALVAALASVPAGAVQCDISVHEAQRLAARKGWKFQCRVQPAGLPGLRHQATLDVNGLGRPGCRVKTSALPGTVRASAEFFGAPQVNTAWLRNGWRIVSYEAGSDVQHHHLPTANFAVLFSWTVDQPNTLSVRRLTRLRIERPNSNCTHALQEAFG